MSKQHQVILKTFSSQEMLDATQIVNDYLKNFESTDMNKLRPGIKAIPAKMEYVFSVDPDEEDETDAFKEANEKKDVNAKFENFYLYITPIDKKTFDQHSSYLLQYDLGNNVNESMESFYEFRFRTPVSILNFVKMLSEKGFVYNYDKETGCDDSCVLPDLMRTINFVTT